MAITVTGETGLIDVLADPGTPLFGTGIEVVGKTAKLKVRAQTNTSVPGFVLSGGNFTETGETAQITMVVNPGIPVIGNKQPGDYWVSPTVLTGTGSKTWDTDLYTVDGDEPPENSTILFRTRWFRYEGADTSLEFSLASVAGVWIEIWEAPDTQDPGTWTYLGGGEETFATDLGYIPTGTNIIIRVGTDTGGLDAEATLSYDATTPVDTDPDAGGESGNLQVMLVDDGVMLETPDNLQFSLFNAADDATVTITLVGTGVLISYQADDSGVILGASIPIPELAAGTYSLSFSGGGEASIQTFQVLEDPVPLPTAPAADDAPVLPGAPHRWILQDPAGVLDEFEFTYNPERMSDPHGARWFTSDATSAPDGQGLVWEALPRAVDWEFAGYLDAELDLEALEAYANIRRRFFLIDHRDRVWITTFTGFDPQPKRVVGMPYSHRYTVKAILYGEVS